jgi:hypothetical protein
MLFSCCTEEGPPLLRTSLDFGRRQPTGVCGVAYVGVPASDSTLSLGLSLLWMLIFVLYAGIPQSTCWLLLLFTGPHAPHEQALTSCKTHQQTSKRFIWLVSSTQRHIRLYAAAHTYGNCDKRRDQRFGQAPRPKPVHIAQNVDQHHYAILLLCSSEALGGCPRLLLAEPWVAVSARPRSLCSSS